MPISWHIKDVYAHGGILGFWKGVAPTIIRAMLMNGTKLGVYDTIKHIIIDRKYMADGITCQFVASVIAGFF